MGLLVDELLLLASSTKTAHSTEHRRPAQACRALGHRPSTAPPDWPTTLDTDRGCVVVGDPSRLRQAGSILSNARSHTPEDAHRRLRARHRPRRRRCGRRPRPRHSEGARRAPVGTPLPRPTPPRRVSGGSGLGLSIVDAIARGHAGSVEVERTLADGATFRIVLPTDHYPHTRCRQRAKPPRCGRRDRRRSAWAARRGGRCRIRVREDEWSHRRESSRNLAIGDEPRPSLVSLTSLTPITQAVMAASLDLIPQLKRTIP